MDAGCPRTMIFLQEQRYNSQNRIQGIFTTSILKAKMVIKIRHTTKSPSKIVQAGFKKCIHAPKIQPKLAVKNYTLIFPRKAQTGHTKVDHIPQIAKHIRNYLYKVTTYSPDRLAKRLKFVLKYNFAMHFSKTAPRVPNTKYATTR